MEDDPKAVYRLEKFTKFCIKMRQEYVLGMMRITP